MIFVVEPHVAVGPLRLGATMAEVRSALGVEPKSMRKTPLSQLPADFFSTIGVDVHYRSPGTSEAYEFHSPAQLVLFTTPLLGRPFNQLLCWFKTIDPDVQLNAEGLTSLRFGVGLYAPFAQKMPAEKTEGAIVFVPDYYEAARARLIEAAARLKGT